MNTVSRRTAQADGGDKSRPTPKLSGKSPMNIQQMMNDIGINSFAV